MKKLIPLLLIVAGLGYWGYQTWFPDEEARIRNRFQELARILSVSSEESPVSWLAGEARLGSYFDNEVILRFVRGDTVIDRTFERENLLGRIRAVRSTRTDFKVRFYDIEVLLGPNSHGAEAYLTAVIDIDAERAAVAEELKVQLRKRDGTWSIRRVETVRTFQI